MEWSSITYPCCDITNILVPLMKTSNWQKVFAFRGARVWNDFSREAKQANGNVLLASWSPRFGISMLLMANMAVCLKAN